ncbi:TolC family protein [Mariprofundus ferrooxydans]|nr:TolC family protein [Mariprofundus ferrooxydans]
MVLLTGCASYQPLPLESPVRPGDTINLLKMDASKHTELPLVWRQRHMHLDDGLDENEIVQLAVLNSPRLQAVQTQLQQAQAQLIQAGLLPDPQLSLSADIPAGSDPTLVTGYGFGLGFDLQSLITRGARQSAASKQARTTYLKVLWQEWQIIQQARMLYRRALMQAQQIKLTHAQFLQTQSNWQVQKNALDQGNATLDMEGLSRTSMMDAQAAWFEARRQRNNTMHSLALLLGLSAQANIPIAPPAQGLSALIIAPIEQKPLQQALNNLDHKRPDLLALKTAYQAQEARVRQQILTQFPSFSIGANRIRDTGGIWTLGPFINLNLPLLNANRGNIAIARATRARLRSEYHHRLTAAETEASRLASDQQLAFDELAALKNRLPDLDVLMQRMRRALAGGNVDMLIFTTLQNSHFSQHMKVLMLEQTILEQAVALDTVLGTLPLNMKSTGYQP